MYRAPQFLSQYVMNQSVPLDSAQTVESRRNECDLKVRFAFWSCSNMSRMLVGLIDDVDCQGRKGGFEFFSHGFGDGHVWTFLSGTVGSRIGSAQPFARVHGRADAEDQPRRLFG